MKYVFLSVEMLILALSSKEQNPDVEIKLTLSHTVKISLK
jgi:hypothetical protein